MPINDRMLGVELEGCVAAIDITKLSDKQTTSSEYPHSMRFGEAPTADSVITKHQIFPAAKLHHPSRPSEPIDFGEGFRRGLIESFDKSGLAVQLDFNHASGGGLFSSPSADEGAAAGWVTSLEDRGNDGLWAEIDWTDRGLKSVRAREYRYLSPEFSLKQFDKTTGEVADRPRLYAVALTNRPFLERQERLAATDAPTGAEKEMAMSDPKAAVDPKAPVEVTEEPKDEKKDEKDLRLELAEKQLSESNAQIAAMKRLMCEQAIKAGVDAGRIPPAQLPQVNQFAEAVGYDFEKVSKFVAGFAVQVRPQQVAETPAETEAKPTKKLSDEEYELGRRLGLSDEMNEKLEGVDTITFFGRYLDKNGEEIEIK